MKEECSRLKVSEVWSALAMYESIAQRFDLQGPWEVTLALSETAGACLGHFGEGWAEPYEGFATRDHCQDRNLIWSREFPDWPDHDATFSVAAAFGGMIEDAFGHRERRFISRVGPRQNEFDEQRIHH